MSLPNPRRSFLLRYSWVVEAASVVPAVLGSIVGSRLIWVQFDKANEWLTANDREPLRTAGLWCMAVGALLSVAVAVLRCFVAKAESERANAMDSVEDLYGCCCVLRSMLTGPKADPDPDIRVTVYRVSKRLNNDPVELEQIIPYASSAPRRIDNVGRRYPSSCGIIGRSARMKDMFRASRESEEPKDFYASMVDEWGYTEEQARDLDITRWSWMSVPLFDRNRRVEGVVFLDASAKSYFTDDRLPTIVHAVETLGAFALERYP